MMGKWKNAAEMLEDRVDHLKAALDHAVDARDRLRDELHAAVRRPGAGFVVCAFCDRIVPRPAIRAHIESCEKHPMAALKAELAPLKEAVEVRRTGREVAGDIVSVTTEAGKRLLASDFDTTGWGPSTVRRHVTEAVLAIEAEARIDGRASGVDYERARIRAGRRGGRPDRLPSRGPAPIRPWGPIR